MTRTVEITRVPLSTAYESQLDIKTAESIDI